ncbi:MAG: DUF2141 domain-containing protein [Sphingomonadaceae bacterium]|nr:DUF2141 domain-containing protein [Sphingomonadaceae bacterium]
MPPARPDVSPAPMLRIAALPALALLAAVSLPATSAAGNSPAGAVTVSVSGLKHTRGKLIACLWREKPGFPTCQKSKSARRQTIAITGNTMRITFPDVAPGQYAVTIQHDEDSDGKLDTNFIGMPKEGVGVSNNPGGMPGWKKSLVPVAGDTSIAVTIRYLFG